MTYDTHHHGGPGGQCVALCIADLQNMAVAEWLQSLNSARGPMERLRII